ncbi:hypothetical protein [Streptomyces cremeus]|uniref:Uncharacterized protein n=1 Tax=Streptomyces cremeus TaxID=66881 RepID=A0ABV5P7X0_STRCM
MAAAVALGAAAGLVPVLGGTAAADPAGAGPGGLPVGVLIRAWSRALIRAWFRL